MNPDLTRLLIVIGCAGAIVLGFLLVVWLATRPNGKHEPRSKREPYVPAYGATEQWSPKREMPPARPLGAHLTVYDLEKIAEEEFETAREKLGAARRDVARFEMERDAKQLRDVETAIIQKIRWTGYDPREATQEIDRAAWLAGVEASWSVGAGKR